MAPRILTLFLILTLPTTGAVAEKVALQLRWDHQFQFAGYYAAKWQGYYADAGFDVDIRSAVTPEGKILKATDEVSNGNADFGVGAADILIARDRGAPLVVLASIFQQSAVEFYAPRATGMKTPADLADLRVSRRLGDVVDVEMQAMLMAEGINPNLVKAYPFDQSKGYLAGMEAGNIDVIPGYAIGTPHEAMKIGLDVVRLRPSDYGVDFYGDSLFTTERMVLIHPDRVESFVRASLKGWEYALEHPEEITGRILAEYRPRFPIEDFRSFLSYQIQPVRELTLYPIVETGNVNPARWARMHATLKRFDMVHGNFDAREVIFDPVRARLVKEHKFNSAIQAILFVIIFIVTLFVAWTAVLRKAVSEKTKALSESERKYRLLADNAADVIWTMDVNHKYTYMSPSVSRLLGYSPEEAMTIPLEKRLTPASFAIARKLIAERQARWQNGEPDDRPNQMEIEQVRKTGGAVWTEVVSNPILDHNGRPLGIIGVTRDITERKKAEHQLQAYSERLEEMVEARTRELKKAQAELLLNERMAVLGNIAGSLSHEIRNPLAAIDTSAYFLNMKLGGENEKVAQHLGRISRNVRKAAAIIESLLNLTSMEKPSVREHDMAALIPEILDAADIPRTVQVVTRFPEHPTPVHVDENQIRMAVKNIIKNAVQAMEEKGTIAVTVRRACGAGFPDGHGRRTGMSAPHGETTQQAEISAPKADTVEISIADDGPGIPPEQFEKVFDPLFTTKTHGIGFGLSIARMIAENHGGTIRATSAPGKGACFVLTLPVNPR